MCGMSDITIFPIFNRAVPHVWDDLSHVSNCSFDVGVEYPDVGNDNDKKFIAIFDQFYSGDARQKVFSAK